MQLYSQADSKNNQQSKLIATENKRMVARWEEDWSLGEKDEELKKYKLAVTK